MIWNHLRYLTWIKQWTNKICQILTAHYYRWISKLTTWCLFWFKFCRRDLLMETQNLNNRVVKMESQSGSFKSSLKCTKKMIEPWSSYTQTHIYMMTNEHTYFKVYLLSLISTLVYIQGQKNISSWQYDLESWLNQ